MPTTEARRRTILEVLEGHEVANQVDLQELLEERGWTANQSQLSRDLRALHVIKQDGVYQTTERTTRLGALRALLRGAQAAGPNLVCVYGEPGSASAIARALEAEEVQGIVGTVAGDDTLFVAVDRKSSGAAVLALIQSLVE
jgi:transcriptional regulator of arginine metabolism